MIPYKGRKTGGIYIFIHIHSYLSFMHLFNGYRNGTQTISGVNIERTYVDYFLSQLLLWKEYPE